MPFVGLDKFSFNVSRVCTLDKSFSSNLSVAYQYIVMDWSCFEGVPEWLDLHVVLYTIRKQNEKFSGCRLRWTRYLKLMKYMYSHVPHNNIMLGDKTNFYFFICTFVLWVALQTNIIPRSGSSRSYWNIKWKLYYCRTVYLQ